MVFANGNLLKSFDRKKNMLLLFCLPCFDDINVTSWLVVKALDFIKTQRQQQGRINKIEWKVSLGAWQLSEGAEIVFSPPKSLRLNKNSFACLINANAIPGFEGAA